MLYGILKPNSSILSSARTFEAFSSMVGAYEGFTVVGAVLGDVLGPVDGGLVGDHEGNIVGVIDSVGLFVGEAEGNMDGAALLVG